jgi:hypothetical protein
MVIFLIRFVRTNEDKWLSGDATDGGGSPGTSSSVISDSWLRPPNRRLSLLSAARGGNAVVVEGRDHRRGTHHGRVEGRTRPVEAGFP